ncbi:MAG: TolC family protein [Deltaproteobacteria bacterium]|nr:TolC family protein [Deltaproteobacteria bacterium]
MPFYTLPIYLLLLVGQLLFSPAVSAETLQLEDAVRIALSSHQRIIQAKERYAASSSLADAARSERLPKIDFSFSYDRLKDQPFEIFQGTALSVNDTDLVHYQLSLSQPLFTGYALTARQKLAELGVDMARYDLQQARRQLALDVHVAALQLLQDSAGRQLAEQQRDQFKSHLADVEAAFSEGMVPSNDRLKAEVALAAAEQQLQSADSRLILARSRLNLLLGRPQQQPLEIAEPAAVTPPQQPLEELIGIALQQRPELLNAKLALAAAGEQIRLARSGDYPQLSLVARYWRDGNDLWAARNPYRNRDNAAIGLRLDWNLFSGGGDRARLSAAQHQRRAQQQVLRELEDMIRLQVEGSLRQLIVADSNSKTADKALQQARENHRLSILQFRENLISTSDLLDARTILTRAEANLQTAHYGKLLAIAQLGYALGRDPLPAAETN